ncbi:DUF3575 domain-containing protein [uncultured Alistipes sp.]|uniref:DUF3575 domain-containing protein n=1 Tax=uncultured Alistipes sp. TaxID=538949 RepID=UPI0025D36066|nr:DUF3575 domain-containing protein [uncultured Alistipes sp.]
MKKYIVLTMLLLGTAIPSALGQKLAVKTNLLYDATSTINLGVEVGLARKWTLDVPFNVNPWKFDSGARLRHWAVQPEIRYWFCESFTRGFIGLHGHYSDFNVGGLKGWPLMNKKMEQSRYQGYLYGAGVSIGRSWILRKRWGLEISAGAGYARIQYDKYPCSECGTRLKHGTKNYFGPTKLSVSLVYMIK